MGKWGMVDASCGPKYGSRNNYGALGLQILRPCYGYWMGKMYWILQAFALIYFQ